MGSVKGSFRGTMRILYVGCHEGLGFRVYGCIYSYSHQQSPSCTPEFPMRGLLTPPSGRRETVPEPRERERICIPD